MALSWQARGAQQEASSPPPPPPARQQLRAGHGATRPAAKRRQPALVAPAPGQQLSALDWQRRGSAPDLDWRHRGAGSVGGGGDEQAGHQQRPPPAERWQHRGGTNAGGGLTATAALAAGGAATGANNENATGTTGRRLNLDMVALRVAGSAVPGHEQESHERPQGLPAGADARNGASMKRIQALLRSGACNCTKNCAAKFSAPVICQICTEFWSLPSKETQDYLLLTMYNNITGATDAPAEGLVNWQHRGAKRGHHDVDDDPPWDAENFGPPDAVEAAVRRRTQWALGDQDVCFEAFHRLLGIGKHRLLKAIAGALDMRRTLPGMQQKQGPREALQTKLCDRFFAELYMSSAEPMPNEFRDCGKDTVGGIDNGANGDNGGPPLDIAFCERDVASMLPHFMQNPLLVQDNSGPCLPVRMLQYSRLHDLYWLFLATVALWLDPLARRPSWMTFWRSWHHKWKGFLRFRGSDEHSKCTFCWKCRKVLATHISLQDKYVIAKRLREHLEKQYSDRCIYWGLRHESRLKGNVLVIIIDSMDKSKLPIPRWKFGEKPKVLEGFVRPVMTLTASIAHGWGAKF